LGEKLADLVEDHSAWSRETFGPREMRGPLGSLKHMAKEIQEATNAWAVYLFAVEDAGTSEEDKNAAYAEWKKEMADILLLLLDSSGRSGVKIMQLVEAGIEKMKENRERDWPKFDSTKVDEAVEHKGD
jgi:hypothetical protein